MSYKKNGGSELSLLKHRSTHMLISISTMLKSSLMVLVLFTWVANTQPVQTIDSEAQLASVLGRNREEETTDELLLGKHAQLVNVTLWKALHDCASSAQRHVSATKSMGIYKLALRIAERLKKLELVATTYYYLDRAYSRTNDHAKAIQAYETSRQLFEQAGLESDLSYVLADLGALYFVMEEHVKAQSYSEQSLFITGQLRSKPTQESLGPIEDARARSIHTLGQIDLSSGNHAEALKKLHEARALLERLNNSGSFYNLPLAQVLLTIANVHSEIGEYGSALSSLSKLTTSQGVQEIRTPKQIF